MTAPGFDVTTAAVSKGPDARSALPVRTLPVRKGGQTAFPTVGVGRVPEALSGNP
ncbi:MAG: hypothetical protein NVS1B16_12820 [Pseudarthrobacter sp.]